MSGGTVDGRAREAALDTRRSFILEAPAGSGKTALLTARYLALLAEVAHPRQILAVTFTRKAAAEMAQRIAGALRDARAGVAPSAERPWDARLLELATRAMEAHAEHPALLEDPHSFMVQTFHGFCASVVRGWPLEAGVAPGLDLLEEDEQAALLEAAAAETLEAAGGGGSPEVTAAVRRRLAAANSSVAQLGGQLGDLLKRRDRLSEFADLLARATGEGDLGRTLEVRTRACAAPFLDELCGWFGAHAPEWRALAADLRSCAEALAGPFPQDVPGNALEDIQGWKSAAPVFLATSGKARQQFQARSGFSKGFGATASADFIRSVPERVARTLDFVAKWPDPSADNVGLVALTDMLLLAAEVSARLKRLQSVRGLDYLELEMAALRALRGSDSPSTSLVFFHEHLHHLLVDEAQDVNDTQVSILGALAEGWERGGNRTLFLVGDPKQSIYRFRRAEVSLFEALRERGLPRAGEAPFPLEPLGLQANFRSRPHLVEFANRLFEGIMASPDKSFDEVAFHASAATRAEDPAGGVTAAFFSCGSSRSGNAALASADNARLAEARWVASSAAALHARDPAATLAILIPARTHLAPFVTALEELGVPVRLLEGRPMLDQPEVRHLLNLFRALLRPYDDVAWAGVLRAPWCRVDDAALDELALHEDWALWSARVLTAPVSDGEVLRFRGVHAAFSGFFAREPYHVTLQRFWEALGGPASSARARGAQAVANVLTFLDHAASCAGLPGEDALARLERLLAQAYTPPDPRGAFSTVSMMTIHRAKGLEFDHVFAVGLHYDSQRHRGADPPAFLMDRVPGAARAVLAASTADRRTGSKTLAYVLLDRLERMRRLAEAKRQFYVAATRARESLALTGLFMKKSDAASEGRSPLAIHWIWQAHQAGRLDGLRFELLFDPAPPEAGARGRTDSRGPREVPPFEPAPLPYRIQSPSRVEDETALAVRPGAEESDPSARAKGIVFHRAFEKLLRGGAPPTAREAAAALSAEGVATEAARSLARDLTGEVRRAWEHAPFRDLCNGAQETRVEWAVEDYDGAGALRVGRIDLMMLTHSGWVLVDYKTGRPGEDVEAWLRGEEERYAPQLRAYAAMAARVLGLERASFRTALLFTAIPRLVWVS